MKIIRRSIMSVEVINSQKLNKKINKTINIESYEILLEDDKFYVNIHLKNISKSIINGFDISVKYSNEEMIINKDNLNIYPNKVIIEKIELKEFIDIIDNIDITNINLEEINIKETIENKKINKIIKYSKIGIPVFLVILICFLLANFMFIPSNKYNNAMKLIENKQYDEAKEILKELDYKDSKEQIELVNARECFDNLDYEKGIQCVLNVVGQVEVNNDTSGGNAQVQSEIIKKSKYIDNDSNKTGYTFYGWSLKSYELDHKDYYAVINLKAEYNPISYSLTFNLDGGTFESDVPSTYTCLDEISIPKPVKKGYLFIGWTGTEIEEPTLNLVIPKGSIGDKEYTANWSSLGLKYELNENGRSYTVYGDDYDSYECSELIIPAYYNDLPVTNIGLYAFYKCLNLTKVIIPERVLVIEDAAFFECANLKDVIIQGELESIKDIAFCYCSNLTNIELPSTVESIGSSAFSGCSNLVNINLPSSLENIGDNAFQECEKLTSIVIPSGIKSIGLMTFSLCTSLTSVKLSYSLESIG